MNLGNKTLFQTNDSMFCMGYEIITGFFVYMVYEMIIESFVLYRFIFFYFGYIDWLSSLYKQQWERMLLAYQGVDIGPKEEMSEERFNLLAFRCGRILEGDMQVSGNCLALLS